MAFIASRDDPSAPVSAAEVAREEGIPPYYLAKVLQDLAKAGLLESLRGRGGGFTLSRSPAQIAVVDVLRAIEDVDAVVTECILGLDECSDFAPCAMHEFWQGYRVTLWDRFCKTNVSDLTREKLHRLNASSEE